MNSHNSILIDENTIDETSAERIVEGGQPDVSGMV